MRIFDYRHLPDELLAPDINNAVSAIHEYKGKQALYLEAKADVLETLCETAKIQSTRASNRIEGIFTTDKRLNEIMAQKADPQNRNEAEIAGYRDVLATIHESYDYIALEPRIILQLHRDLYRHTGASFGGTWKDSDNAIIEFDANGEKRVRFQPMPAVTAPAALEELCGAFDEALKANVYDPLLLIAMFTFDFVCIHPFNDGNGRMSRLLTLLLLYRAGYAVGKYISIETEIEKSKSTYYESLQACSTGWIDGENAYAPFVRYLLGVVLAAYRDFENRVDGLVTGRLSKPERIEAVFERKVGKVTNADILAECPDISTTTVERTLADLQKQGYIEKVGKGRSTGYVKTPL